MNTMKQTKKIDGGFLFEVINEAGVVVDSWETPGPTNTWTCDCGALVERFRGQSDVICDCGQWFNASGSPSFHSDWMRNASTWDEDVSDLDGFEAQHADW